jgi:hypothetical protein
MRKWVNILEHSSHPLIIHLFQMHLYVRVLSWNSRVLPLLLNIIHVCASIATIIPSFPIIPIFFIPFARDSLDDFQLA